MTVRHPCGRQGADVGTPRRAQRPWPPPPHDPRERDLALVIDGWEVRLFGGRKFQYFVARGFWHAQLWHPVAGISVLTPSRLTSGLYEAFPVDHWKAQAGSYDALIALVSGITRTPLPARAQVERVERCFVDEVVQAEAVGRGRQ